MVCLQYGRNTLQQLKNMKTAAAIFQKCEGGEMRLHHPLFYAAQGLRYRKLQIILTTSIDKLGKVGETVKVAPGYFRNHLMPKILAVPNIDKYMHLMEDQRKIYLHEEVEELKIVPATKEDKKKEYQMAATRLDRTKLVLRQLAKKPLAKDDIGRTFIQKPVGKDEIVDEVSFPPHGFGLSGKNETCDVWIRRVPRIRTRQRLDICVEKGRAEGASPIEL